jgi:Ca2+-binding RTX toxin-like protein
MPSFQMENWTVYQLSPESAPPQGQSLPTDPTKAYDPIGNPYTLTLSPQLLDGSPIVYEFYDNKPNDVSNDLRFNLNLNISNQAQEPAYYHRFIIDVVTIPPTIFANDAAHPDIAHFHPSSTADTETFKAYSVDQATNFGTLLPNLHKANRVDLYGTTIQPGESFTWTGAKGHHWDGYFALVITPIGQDVGNRLQGLDLSNPTSAAQFYYDKVVNQSGSSSNVIGTGGNDLLVGVSAYSNIMGGFGQDTALGGDGADTIHGDDGIDYLYGQAGDDSLFGDAGGDMIEGGDGIDTIEGGLGGDWIEGGLGADTIRGGIDPDVIFGEGGDDFTYGEDGADIVNAGAGNDTIDGGGGDDYLDGGEGNDTVNGGEGNDTLIGGFGFDALNGGNGIDTADFTFYSGSVVVNLTTGRADFPGNNPLGQIETNSGVENVVTGSGSDSLTGNGLANRLEGGGGVDNILGAGGNDTLFGGAGDDTLNGQGNSDIIYGGADSDKLIGEAGTDTLRGEDGADTIIGGLDKDNLYGGTGSDRFDFDTNADAGLGATRDIIYDFSQAQLDKIDVRGIDARASLTGNQIFSFRGTQAFNAEGQLRADDRGTTVIVQGSTDNDTAAEFEIEVRNFAGTFAAGDFFF